MGAEIAPTGFTTLVTLLLVLGGLQLLAMGLLGEYLGRIYEEVKQRPLYIVKQHYRDPTSSAANRMAAKTESPGTPSARKRSWGVYAAVVAMLAWYFASSISAVATKSVTFDEMLHLTGGYSYWKFGDFRLQPENGNLPQRWAAIPLLFGDTHFPELSPEEWRMPNMPAIGDAFLYGSGNDADSILRRGRAMIGLLGVALGLLVFLSARSLLGTAPALVSLGLYAFCPTDVGSRRTCYVRHGHDAVFYCIGAVHLARAARRQLAER